MGDTDPLRQLYQRPWRWICPSRSPKTRIVGTLPNMRLGSSAGLVVLLVMLGCGGDDASFAEDYNEAVTPIAELRGRLGAQPENYDRLADRTRETRRNLARLNAPEGATEELDALVAGLDDVTSSLLAVSRAARSEDPVLERRAARRLERSNDEFRRAEDALHRAVEG